MYHPFNSRTMRNIYTIFTLLFFAITSFQAQHVTITNGLLWKDDKGNSVQAHGAGFLKFNDTWYMIGEDRTQQWNPDVNMYSSKDLVNWKFENKIIANGEHSYTYEDGTTGTLGKNRMIERPKLLYSAKTGKFVIWCHWESSNYGASEAAVFYSDDVTGPYKLHWAGRPLGIKSRDCNVFQDDDGKAYFISTTNENRDLGLFELSDDYLSAVKHTVLFKGDGREAPAIAKVDGLYYMISSACTGWAPNQTKLATSTSLTSGWTPLNNIGNDIAFDTQAASILTVSGTKETTYIYVGDRWQDPGLPESKTIMFPVEFANGKMTFDYTRQWDLDVFTGEWNVTARQDEISKTSWKIHHVSSEEVAEDNGVAIHSIDGKEDTFWHSSWSVPDSPRHPHEIQVDMGQEYAVASFLYTPRQDKGSGLIRRYRLYFSQDGINWGDPVAMGNWFPYQTEISFTPIKARYFRFVAAGGESNRERHASIAELSVFGEN